MLTHENLLNVLHYDEDTGIFTWKEKLSFRIKVGAVAGSISKITGYVEIRINGILYRGHELAWFYKTGKHVKYIDHRNNIRHDNRWINLRKASQTQNNRNKSMSRNNNSGYKGVYYSTRRGKYIASVCFNYRSVYVGQYDCPKEAAAAYDKKALELFGEFAKTNQSMGLLE